ncbi:MAG: transporter, partial [Marmoricola sp.]|nr:transporter [Marmoricola sp.]
MVWTVGLLVYVLAVFHRSSLGVAGLVAAERFHISATQLATFTMLQLLVYAGMQIPVGLAVDRFGSR